MLNRTIHKRLFAGTIALLWFMFSFNGQAIANGVPYRDVTIKDFCIKNVQDAILIKDGGDFFVVQITIENQAYTTYIGNNPRVDSAVNQIQTGPFILIQDDNVYKRQDWHFFSFIHFMGVTDLSLVKYFNSVEVIESSDAEK